MSEPDDLWRALRQATSARIGLGRAGVGLPTQAWLDFSMAHALARDAVHAPLDLDAVEAAVKATGHDVVRVDSRAADRQTFLLRPDLGRLLSARSAGNLRPDAAGCDLAVIVGDGLSAKAVSAHAAALLAALNGPLKATKLRLGPVVLASQARVALSDDIGERLRARIGLMLIGERPGLSSPDSLGAYITFTPRNGRTDAERNCVSNIRPEGLGYQAAAARIMWLIGEALRRGLTGIALKDESDLVSVTPARPPAGRITSPE